MTTVLRYGLLAAVFQACLGYAADTQPIKDAGPYVPSPQSVVSDMLRIADVGPSDFLIDLGSGDGRIVLTAAKVFGARGIGVEIKEHLVKLSNEAAQKEGLADRVKFLKQDLFKTDISDATVISMYLLPDTVNLLKDKFLAELKPGTGGKKGGNARTPHIVNGVIAIQGVPSKVSISSSAGMRDWFSSRSIRFR